MSKKIIKTADMDTIYNSLNDATYAKLLKQAKNDSGAIYWNVLAKVAKKIGFGAIKMEGCWYTVLNGEINRSNAFNFSHTAISDMRGSAVLYNVTFSSARQTIEAV